MFFCHCIAYIDLLKGYRDAESIRTLIDDRAEGAKRLKRKAGVNCRIGLLIGKVDREKMA